MEISPSQRGIYIVVPASAEPYVTNDSAVNIAAELRGLHGLVKGAISRGVSLKVDDTDHSVTFFGKNSFRITTPDDQLEATFLGASRRLAMLAITKSVAIAASEDDEILDSIIVQLAGSGPFRRMLL